MITHHFDVEPKQPCQLPSVQLLHASIHHGSPTARCDLHSHIFTELLYILQGSCRLDVDDQQVELHAGDLLVLNPQCPHYGVQPIREPFSMLCIDLCCACCVGGQPAGYLVLSSRTIQPLEPYLRLFFQELQQHSDSFDEVCRQLAR